MGEWKKTQCTVCGVSCGIEVEVENGKIISSRPDKDSPRSHGYACRKGRNSKYFMHHGDRLDYPMKKVNGKFERISWDQAISEIAQKLRAIVDEHGPRAVCGIGGASGGGQSELIFLKALINGLGSQYIFNPIGFEFLGNWWSHGKIFGDQVCFTEPDDCGPEAIVLWGSNSFVTHQMCDARKNLRECAEDPNRLLIVVDPRMSESARLADIHIANRPGTDALMLKGLIALILKKGWENKEYCAKHVKDLDKIRPWFTMTNIEECFRVAGVSMEEMENLARVLTTKKWGVHQDLGLFCGRHSTLNSYLMIMLEVICGVALVSLNGVVNFQMRPIGDLMALGAMASWTNAQTSASTPMLLLFLLVSRTCKASTYSPFVSSDADADSSVSPASTSVPSEATLPAVSALPEDAALPDTAALSWASAATISSEVASCPSVRDVITRTSS